MQYTFYTIHTVVDIGDGERPLIENGSFTTAMNLNRLVDSIMRIGYPMLVSISTDRVNLEKLSNSSYYDLPTCWGYCTVYTFKFSIPTTEHNLNLHGIPLVMPCTVNNLRISKFDFESTARNSSIHKQTF